jgi:hypothetical protein
VPDEEVADRVSGTGGGGVRRCARKEQCKNGGWMSFGSVFRKQGDCVSFVATRGKNPPANSP